MGRAIDLFELAADHVGRLDRQQTGDRQRQDRLDLSPRGSDEAAAVLGQARAQTSISRALVPAMIRLCESWATDEPSAPSCVRPNPLTSPRPIRPEARCRSILAIKRMSRSGSNAQRPSTRRTLRSVRRVTI